MIQDGYNHAEIDDMYCEADRQALESVKIDKKDKEMGNYHFDIGPYKFIHPETDEMIIKRLQSKTTPSK
jgi:hypothetical protein